MHRTYRAKMKTGVRMTEGDKPAGRPPRHKGERLSKNRTFRVRGELDEKLQRAADTSGRSVSEEIEFRLEKSFADEERAEERSRELNQIVATLGETSASIESNFAKLWERFGLIKKQEEK
jgi:hypothetical protein